MNAEPHIHLHPADGLPMPRRVWAILAVAFGVSLSVIDGTIANVALPTIGQELGISSADSIWIVNAYQLAIMVSLLSFSALGDVVGYRKIYIGGLMLFTVASVACALSGSLQTLVLARVMQGFGAAAITSVNTTLIRFIYPKAQLGRGMGINATVVAVSSVAGPTLAAGILSVASWPWLFAVNIPMGLVALALSRRFLPENPVRVSAHRFDWRDAVMNALTFGLLMASVEGFSHGLDPRLLTLGVAALLVIGFFFIRSQLREPYPILPFDLLRIPIFSVSVLTSICSFLGQMLAMVALPFYLQDACGYNDVQTGLLLTAWPAIIMIVAPAAGITNQKVFLKDATKISICLELPHESSSLYHLLSHFAYNDLNMTKIESRPMEGKSWEYRFFIDFEGNLADPAVKNAIRGLREESRNLRILGNY